MSLGQYLPLTYVVQYLYLYICVFMCVWLKAKLVSGPARSEDKERTIKYHGSFTLDEVSDPNTLDLRAHIILPLCMCTIIILSL
jgi:hypothetical protein